MFFWLLYPFTLSILFSLFLQYLKNGTVDPGEISTVIPMPADRDDGDIDISEYKFSKFAAMYFQYNATHTYIRRALKQPLLPLHNEGDQLVSFSSTSSMLTHSLLTKSKAIHHRTEVVLLSTMCFDI